MATPTTATTTPTAIIQYHLVLHPVRVPCFNCSSPKGRWCGDVKMFTQLCVPLLHVVEGTAGALSGIVTATALMQCRSAQPHPPASQGVFMVYIYRS